MLKLLGIRMGKKHRILQLTDSHIVTNSEMQLVSFNTCASFNAVLNHAKKEIKEKEYEPELVVFSGDIIHDNSEKSYQLLKEQMNYFSCPVIFIPGNHDNPELLTQNLQNKPFIQTKEMIIDSWQIIALNSHWPKHIAGILEKDQLEFLDNCLSKNKNLFAMIVLHHHVIPVSSNWLNEHILSNSKDFWKIVNKYKNVKIVTCGHVHQDNSWVHGNVNVYSTPSTSFQFSKSSSTFSLSIRMPGYRWFTLNDDGKFKTNVVRIPHNNNYAPNLSSSGY
jgi:Icc protein